MVVAALLVFTGDVVVIQVDYHGDFRREVGESGIGLVDLGHKPVAVPDPHAAGEGGQDRTNLHRRVAAGRKQDLRDHARGGALAVRTGDAYCRDLPEELGEQLDASEHPYSPAARLDQLGFVVRHCGGRYQGVDAFQVAGVVSDLHLDAESPQLRQRSSRIRITAAHAEAQCMKVACEASHAHATDTHEVEVSSAHL